MASQYQYINSTGVIVPDTAETRATVEAEFQSVFGTDMPLDPSTPQGGLVTLLTEARDGMVRNNAELANQINPDLAGGVFLSAIWRFTGGKRRPGSFSRLIGVELAGQPNTLIPAGSIATASESGAQFATTAAVLIGPLGTVTSDFQALEAGPINVPIGGLDSIASGVLGWETVSNPSAAIPGKLVEGDIPARLRRRQTLALQTISSTEAIISALYDTDGVESLSFRENVAPTTQVIDGITMVAHSIYACVDGGADEAVAFVLMREKTDGAAFNGAVTVNVTQPLSNQVIPVQFDRPDEIQVFVRFTVRPSPLDVQNIIPDTIIAYRDGEIPGDRGFTVGTSVSPFELSGAVHQVAPSIFVTKVELSTDSGATWSTNSVPVALDQVARVTRSSVLVVIA